MAELGNCFGRLADVAALSKWLAEPSGPFTVAVFGSRRTRNGGFESASSLLAGLQQMMSPSESAKRQVTIEDFGPAAPSGRVVPASADYDDVGRMSGPADTRRAHAKALGGWQQGNALGPPDREADELSPSEFRRVLNASRSGENVRAIIAEACEAAPQRQALNDDIRRRANVGVEVDAHELLDPGDAKGDS